MIYKYRSVKEIQSTYAPIMGPQQGYRITTTYDLSSIRLHNVEIDWLEHEPLLKTALPALLWLPLVMILGFIPFGGAIMSLGQVIPSLKFKGGILSILALAVVCYPFALMITRNKYLSRRADVQIRKEVSAPDGPLRYAVVREKDWPRFVKKLKPTSALDQYGIKQRR